MSSSNDHGYFTIRPQGVTPGPRYNWSDAFCTPYEVVDVAMNKKWDWTKKNLKTNGGNPILFDSTCASVLRSGEELVLHGGAAMNVNAVKRESGGRPSSLSGAANTSGTSSPSRPTPISTSPSSGTGGGHMEPPRSGDVKPEAAAAMDISPQPVQTRATVQSHLAQSTARRAQQQTGLVNLFRVSRLVDDGQQSLKEKLIGTFHHFVPAEFLDLGAAAARTVARVTYDGNSDSASGFLISPRVFLTNAHVLPHTIEASIALLDFQHVHKMTHVTLSFPRTHIKDKAPVRLDPNLLFYCNVELDYAVVALREPTVNSRPHLYLHSEADTNKLCPLDSAKGGLYIVQHPDGRHKEADVQGRRQHVDISKHPDLVADPLASKLLFYGNDTEGGSSGSPVCNQDWIPVALHREFLLHPDSTKVLCNVGVTIASIAEDLLMKVRAKVDSGVLIEKAEMSLLREIFSFDKPLSTKLESILILVK